MHSSCEYSLTVGEKNMTLYAGLPFLAHSPVHKYFNCAAIWRPKKMYGRHHAITLNCFVRNPDAFEHLFFSHRASTLEWFATLSKNLKNRASIESVIISDRWWVWAFSLVIQNNKQVKFTYEGQSYKLVVRGILKT